MEHDELIERIKRIEHNTERMLEKQHSLDIRITKIETKAALIGAISAMFITIISIAAKLIGK